ncbi:MAG: peptidase C1 [Bacteroidetes bacterium 4572_117]|nr:MAG: peptidase C1 [Bacteroidetes bacterium 4572_117]
MKKITLIIIVLISWSVSAQKKDKSMFRDYAPGFYQNFILKDVSNVKAKIEKKDAYRHFQMDQSKLDLPNKVDLYKRVWAQGVISQGNAGSCWAYSTISFLESEIFRINKKKVKLSEPYIVYWEYVAKARGFVQTRGKSLFSQGSEGNAVTRIMKEHGLVPASEYSGLKFGRKYHSHAVMFKEMKAYLKSVKESNNWNEKAVIATIKSIMGHHIGEPPAKFTIEGKEYTPISYMNDYAKLNPNDFVEILSYVQEPYWKQVEYKVPDNWWHNKDYYNVPLNIYMDIIEKAIKKGYTMSIGGDVSEAGFVRKTQCAIIPTFDIPAEYINEDARQFRFSNESTTDDHGMHMVGWLEKDGKKWYLIKDSSSGSRNNDPKAAEFGYYFFNSDYVKLKMMGFTIHKDAVKDILKKFKK